MRRYSRRLLAILLVAPFTTQANATIYAPDIGGVSSTTAQLAGAVGLGAGGAFCFARSLAGG